MQTDVEEWVWRTAFFKSYDSDSFHDWWSAKDNLMIQKEGGIFQILVTPPDDQGEGENVDFLLYHINHSVKGLGPPTRADRCPNGYYKRWDLFNTPESKSRLVSIDLRQKLEKYAIFSVSCEGYTSWKFKFFSSTSNLLSVANVIYKDYKSTNAPTDYLIVDLSRMILVENYQGELERKQMPFSDFDFDQRGYLFLYVDEYDESDLLELLKTIYAPVEEESYSGYYS